MLSRKYFQFKLLKQKQNYNLCASDVGEVSINCLKNNRECQQWKFIPYKGWYHKVKVKGGQSPWAPSYDYQQYSNPNSK